MAGSKKKDNNNNKPKSKKKLLIILIPIGVILIAAIAAAVIFVPKFLNKEEKKVVVKPPEFYFTKKDAIDSVTVVLGERRFELVKEEISEEDTTDTYDFLLGTGTVILEPEEEAESETGSMEGTEVGTESADGTQSASQEDTAQAEEAESASETETTAMVILEVYQYYPGEIAETETESGSETETGSESAQEEKGEEEETREAQEDVAEEVGTYLEYLQNEKSFIDITNIAVNMGEFGEFAQEDSEGDVPEEEVQDGPVFHVLTGPAADEEQSLLISVVCYPAYYQVRTWTQEVPWTQQMSMLWGERDRQDEERRERELAKEQGETEGMSEEEETEEIDTIEELVSSLGQEALQLPEPVDRYEFIFNSGNVRIDGKEYRRVGTYYKNEKTGTVNYECTFLVDENGEVHYKYYDATGEVEPLGGEAKPGAETESESVPAEDEVLPEESETESQEG